VSILEGRYGRAYIVDLVVLETYTLLRYRLGYRTAVAFLEALRHSGVNIIFLDRESSEGTIKVLKKYSNRRLSFTDAFLIYVLNSYGIENLASYDEKSFSGILPNVFGKGYAETISKEEFNRIMRLVNSFKAY